MATCADVLATTLRASGIRRMFGLPGGEVLDLLDAARRAGIEFVLAHDETAAAFMADAAGQIERRPGVAVATLGPGALNMLLGVANAWLDRSPVVAITAGLASSSAPVATHQNIDLHAVYRPVTKATVALDGTDTAGKVRCALRTSLAPRPGPVHLVLPSDVARAEDRPATGSAWDETLEPPPMTPPSPEALARVAAAIRAAKRPVVIAGLDLAPYTVAPLVRAFVDHLGVPSFVAPKAKGVIPEDHPLFGGVCAGVAADHLILRFFERADLLVGIGYDPVESNHIWHHSMKLVSLGPLSIAAGDYRPYLEVTGAIEDTLERLLAESFPSFDWSHGDVEALRRELDGCLHPRRPATTGGLSPYEVTRCLQDRLPDDTIVTTDVGCVKFITSQAWRSRLPSAFLQSNGLSSMGFALPAAIAARLAHPSRTVLCTVGDGGLCMGLGEIETAVRLRLPVIVVVFNDAGLSLIDVIQANRGYPRHGVRYGPIDFAAAARALGASGTTARTLPQLALALDEALLLEGPAVIDVPIDAEQYRAQTKPWSSR